tara:strand:+ start:6721 stop:7236 length:516 start_codon:yes stop_codon:yes gene_type:complete
MNLKVYDDAVTRHERGEILHRALQSQLRLGWRDQHVNELNYQNLYSDWTLDDLESCGLWKYFQAVIDDTPWFTKSQFSRSVLNVVRPTDVHLIHTHSSQADKVILYYVNLEWKDGWYGETLFYSDDIKDVAFTSPFVPGRIILFDGQIPHAIRPQSVAGPKYRLSISTFFS